MHKCIWCQRYAIYEVVVYNYGRSSSNRRENQRCGIHITVYLCDMCLPFRKVQIKEK